MAIYRGPGGAGDATTDSSTEAAAALSAAAQAATSATNAANSATSATNSATTATTKAGEAASSATSAAASATTATTQANNASSYASNAATSATTATTKASEAAGSATTASNFSTTAGTYATNSATSATAAGNYATNASTSATNSYNSSVAAATSATNAATSATNAASSASSASSSASTATTQATNAASSATAAATSASTATTKASEASTSATNAANSATSASTSATNAANSATAATTSAANSANSATSSAGSASSAAAAQIAAETARDQTLAAYDNFDDRYLGTKASDPTLDNDGNALVAGALYFNSSDGAMKVYTGTAWVAAYASLSGALLAANNLSDVQSVSSARTNLGLGTAATTASTDYATAAQGTKADTAYGWGNHASAGYAADSLVAHLSGTETITGTKTFSSTITGSITGNAGTVTNGVYTTGSYSDPTWLTLSKAKVGLGNVENTALSTSTFNLGTTAIIYGRASGAQSLTGISIDGNAGTATTATNQSGGTVAATTGSFSGSVTLSGGTANGVAYLNGSKVLTTGSALTFDGTNLGIGLNNPSAKVHSKISSAAQINNVIENSVSYLNYGVFADGNNYIFTGTTAPLLFGINNAEQMRLTSTGLGIGTSSPAQRLSITAANNSRIENYADSNHRQYVYSNAVTGAQASGIGQGGYASLTSGGVWSGTKSYAGFPSYNVYFSNESNKGFHFVQQGAGSTTTDGGITDLMYLNDSGNLGLGVTPSAWNAGNAALETPYGWITGRDQLNIGCNLYYNYGTKYIQNGYATLIQSSKGSGGLSFQLAPSGTAGSAAAFTTAMTLDASGNLGIGIASPTTTLDIYRASTPQQRLSNSGTYEISLGVDSGNVGWVGSTNGTNLAFKTLNSERMRIDTSGNVGIGTSSPNKTGFTAPVLSITNGTSGIVELVGTQTADGTIGQVAWYNTSGSSRIGQILGLRSGADTSGAITFQTASSGTLSERMRIDSSGNLLVNQTSSSGAGKFEVSFDPNTQVASRYNMTSSTYNNATIEFRIVGGTRVGYIFSNGTSTTYSTSSDYRLKENVQPMQNALGVVAQLNPVTYTWKADGSDGQGFIAHELQAVVPDCVTGEKDAVDEEGKPVYQGIDTSFLVATLTKAIQEQQEQINQLKAEVAALKGN